METRGLPASERIKEVTMMCSRENPVYEQISSFSIALYVLGCTKAQDLMDVNDLDERMASEILKENFREIEASEIPKGYAITESEAQYLLVAGDTVVPAHFAVVADSKREKPFFSKLDCLGSGYDSLDELSKHFFSNGEMRHQEFHYFKRI